MGWEKGNVNGGSLTAKTPTHGYLIGETTDGGVYLLPQLTSDFSAVADGAVPADADSGHPWTLGWFDAASTPTIKSGRLTNGSTEAGVAAAYTQANLGATANRIGGRFSFVANSTAGESVGLQIWKTAYLGLGGAVPDASCHLSLTPTGWTYATYTGGVKTDLLTGNYAAALATDGTIYEVDVAIEGNVARVRLPDGRIVEITHASIGTNAAQWTNFETFQNVASTDGVGGWITVWAGTAGRQPQTLGPTMGELLKVIADVRAAQPAAVSTHYGTVGGADIALTTSPADLDATNLAVTFNVPRSGNVLVLMSAIVVMTGACNVLFDIREGASTVKSEQVVFGGTVNQRLYHAIKVTGLTPFSQHTYKFGAHASIGSTASIKDNSTNGCMIDFSVLPSL